MEEKERNDRDVQEIQQQTSESIQQSSSNNPSEIIVSKSVGPFCLRRPVGGRTNPQGKFVAFSIGMVHVLIIHELQDRGFYIKFSNCVRNEFYQSVDLSIFKSRRFW